MNFFLHRFCPVGRTCRLVQLVDQFKVELDILTVSPKLSKDIRAKIHWCFYKSLPTYRILQQMKGFKSYWICRAVLLLTVRPYYDTSEIYPGLACTRRKLASPSNRILLLLRGIRESCFYLREGFVPGDRRRDVLVHFFWQVISKQGQCVEDEAGNHNICQQGSERDGSRWNFRNHPDHYFNHSRKGKIPC